jgi:hypothetical protein
MRSFVVFWRSLAGAEISIRLLQQLSMLQQNAGHTAGAAPTHSVITSHQSAASACMRAWRAGLTVLCMLVPTLLSHQSGPDLAKVWQTAVHLVCFYRVTYIPAVHLHPLVSSWCISLKECWHCDPAGSNTPHHRSKVKLGQAGHQCTAVDQAAERCSQLVKQLKCIST